MSIDLLVAISVALKKDFIKFFYDAEPMKSIRDDETILLKSEIQKIMQEKITLERELALMQNLVESQKETICFAKEQLDHYKSKLLEFSGNKPGLSAI